MKASSPNSFFTVVEDELRRLHEGLRQIDSQLLETYRECAVALYSGAEEGINGELCCRRLKQEITEADCQHVADVLACPSFAAFQRLCEAGGVAVPRRLLQDGADSAVNLKSFIEARVDKFSPDKHMASFVDSMVRMGAAAGPRQAGAARSADLEKTTLIATHRDALTTSDHRAIQSVLCLPQREYMGEMRACNVIAVVSHNVMERVQDGLGIYLQSLPFVRGRKGQPTLLEAMTKPSVLEQHAKSVEGLCKDAFRRGCVAVCLQEVDPGLLSHLKRESSWQVNACGSVEGALRSPGACKSTTCIVSKVGSADPLEDIVMHYQTKGGEHRSRRFAAVSIAPDVILVTVHVRHQTGQVQGQAYNREHIEDAMRTLCHVYQDFLQVGGTVLIVGDFNGPLTQSFDVGSQTVSWLAAAPDGPTHYGKPHPVDGAMAFQSAEAMKCATLACDFVLDKCLQLQHTAQAPTGL